jgi:glucose-1-phosphate cytidylyltransferase
MKVAILAGGKGTRLGPHSQHRPKPMVEIGGSPILLHIMEHYLSFGHGSFVIAIGHRGEVIERWFRDFGIGSDLSKGMAHRIPGTLGAVELSLVRTGLQTETGGRVKRLEPYLANDTFMLTWGDGLCNVNLDELMDFHYSHGRLATVTAVRPPARFGHLAMEGARVLDFAEKAGSEAGWINGAFFVLEPEVFAYIGGDDASWERDTMTALARDGELMAFKHHGFWQCMDTPQEKALLENMWQSGQAPWLERHISGATVNGWGMR